MPLHRPLCDCHDAPRIYEDWMCSWWDGMLDVFSFTVRDQHPILVHCGGKDWQIEPHGHPYKDPHCGVSASEQLSLF